MAITCCDRPIRATWSFCPLCGRRISREVPCKSPKCDVLFIKSGKKEYCSVSCSGRHRAAIHYEANREIILRDRRERYRSMH